MGCSFTVYHFSPKHRWHTRKVGMEGLISKELRDIELATILGSFAVDPGMSVSPYCEKYCYSWDLMKVAVYCQLYSLSF